VFTSAKAVLAAQATALAGEATTAGLTALSTALTNLATEITYTSINDAQFFTHNFTVSYDQYGVPQYTNYWPYNVGQTWAQIISSAAETIRARVANNTYTKIADIDTQVTTIATNTANIATYINNMKTDLDTLAANSTIMKDLAQGTGIHVIGPYDWIGYASLYHLYVEQGKFSLDSSTNQSPTQQANNLAVLTEYLQKIRNLPTLY
jgi:hypothetical protein